MRRLLLTTAIAGVPAAGAATHHPAARVQVAGPLTRSEICGEYACVENEGDDTNVGMAADGTGYSDEYTTTWGSWTVHAWSSPDGDCLQGFDSYLREAACNDGSDELFGLKSNGEWFNVGQSGDCAASPDVDYVIYVGCPDNPASDEVWTIG